MQLQHATSTCFQKATKLPFLPSILAIFLFIDSSLAATTVKKAIGPEYKAGIFWRVLMGSHWRSFWTKEIDIPFLDLKHFGGGLTILKKGGGMQTKGLRFLGRDGREYKFRSINKNPARGMPPELADSLLADILQDQVSVFNPLASFVVDPIANAMGVYQTKPYLVILPDDAALGEFQSEYKNTIGTIEENPTVFEDEGATIEGADKIISTLKLYKKIEKKGSEQIDAKAFLRARLLDIFIGDPDRHHKQWRWARVNESANSSDSDSDEEEVRRIWKPIARDRDQAFARYDGFFPWLSTQMLRQLNGTSANYPRMEALTWSGRHIDRRFLTRLTREEWNQVTDTAVAALTDDVISTAVHQLPAPLYELEGKTLEAVLRARRDHLKEASREFYSLLFRYVDIRGTTKDDYIEINNLNDKQTRVTISSIKKSTGNPKKTPFYDQTFDSKDTSEIRIFTLEGNDTIQKVGSEKSKIDVQIYKGEDNFPLDAKNDAEKYEPPTDYGYDIWFQPLFQASTTEGVLLGGGPILYKYGVHQYPYVYRMQARGGYAIGNGRYYFDFKGDYPAALSPFHLFVDAKASQLEVQNYFGMGNETPKVSDLESLGFYKLHSSLFEILPRIEYPFTKSIRSYLAVSARYTDVKSDETNTLVGITQPGGISTNMLLGGGLGIKIDTRDNSVFTNKGIYLDANAMGFPKSLDNPHRYAKMKLDVRSYLSWHLLTDTTLSLRAYGERISGQHPFYDSSYLGGDTTLRGYVPNRFAGDALLLGSAEIRFFLAKVKFLFPTKLGIYGFTDAGRVYLNNDDSRQFHLTYGGGLWSSIVKPEYTLVATYAHSTERYVISLRLGSAF